MRWIASASALAAASVASAATWNFDLATGGEDVMWMSPSAVNPAAFAYEGSYEITAVTATVVVVIPVQVDVTNQVPPEFLTGTASVAGPAPLVLIDEFVASPPPPDPAQIAANVRIELDAAGFGVASATDVVLGDVTVNVPPFGEVTVPLQAISFAGTITVDEVLTHPADFNADGVVNGSDLAVLLAAWGPCPAMDPCPADLNGDGVVNGSDLAVLLAAWG